MNTNILSQSLIDYINDVKPFHSKFRNSAVTTSQILLNDSLHVNVKDDHIIQSNSQNIWGVDDVGGYILSNMSDGAYIENLHFSGIGNGILSFIVINPINAVMENWILTATSSTSFSVFGSISGVKTNIVIDRNYDNEILNFSISQGSIKFAIGDIFTFSVAGIQQYSIPAMVLPRFSRSDRIEQDPIGDDPTSLNPADLPFNTTTSSHQLGSSMIPVKVSVLSSNQIGANFNIIIDNTGELLYGFDPSTIQISINGITWLGSYTKIGNKITILSTPINPMTFEILYLGTGRYATPYHQGSRVYINGVIQKLDLNFIVNYTRSFIQFLPSHHPLTTDIIDINLFRSDRLFISWQDPFYFKDENSFDVGNFDLDGLFNSPSDYFLITAIPSNGIISAGSFVIGTSYTITSIGTTNFTLIGGVNVIGSIFTATNIGIGTGTASTNAVSAGYFAAKTYYTIASIGTTDFTLIGASSNTIGLTFTATGKGTGTGIAVPAVEYSVSFFSDQNNTHKASIQNISISSLLDIGTFDVDSFDVDNFDNGVTWKLTATGPWEFSVQNTSVSPITDIGIFDVDLFDVVNFDNIDTLSMTNNAIFKTPYSDGVLSFTIDRNWSNFYIDQGVSTGAFDSDVFDTVFDNMGIPVPIEYTSYYIEQDLNSYISYDSGLLNGNEYYDPSEFFPNSDIVTQHGVVIDPTPPRQQPVRFRPFGVVKRTISTDFQDDYVFQFDKIPPPYTYIEFRIEQEGQYNPWVSTTITEDALIKITYINTDAWHMAGQTEILNLIR